MCICAPAGAAQTEASESDFWAALGWTDTDPESDDSPANAASTTTPLQDSDEEALAVIPVSEERSAAPQETLEAAPRRKPQLEEIIVTATKREKSVRDVPASIAAIDGRDLEFKGTLSVNEIIEQTPGVSSNSARPGDQRIIMRGISTSSSATSTTPYPVGIFVGDTAFSEPYAASITPDLSAFDLQDIEILKGPQGTLFGGAALSGAVRYRISDPVTDAFQLRAFSQYTSLAHGDSAFTHGAAVNLPLLSDDTLGLRLTYIRREYPGLYDDIRPEHTAEDVNAARGEQFRAGLLWRPSDDWHVKLSYVAQDYDASNDLIISDYRDGRRETRGSLQPWPSQHRFGMFNLYFQYDFENMSLVSSSSRTEKERYNSIESLGSLIGAPPPGIPDALALPFITDQESTSFQQELRLQSSGGETFEWLVGGYYYRSPIRYFLSINAQGLSDIANTTGQLTNALLSGLRNPLSSLLGDDNALLRLIDSLSATTAQLPCELYLLCAETNAIATESALFADLTYTPWHFLDLSLGARFYRTQVDGGFTGRGVIVRTVNNGLSPADFRDSIEERGISPKASVTVRFNDDLSAYALASRGFRFGGIQNIPADPIQGVPGTYKSDFIWNYELGLRSSWFDNTLQFDVTGFYIDYENPLLVLKNAVQINYYDNVGAAKSHGVEANFRWLTPIPGIMLAGGGGIVDARTTVPFRAGNVDVPAGKPLPGSAREQYNAQVLLMGPPDAWFAFGATLDYTYIGEAHADITSDRIVGDYGTLNASLRLGLNHTPGKPTLALSVSNITDEAAPIGIIGTSIGNDFFLMNAPRTFVARLSVDFE